MVSKVVASDQFKQVWINANRAAHRQVVGVLTGQGGTAPTSDTGAVKLLDRLTIVLPLLTLALFAAGIWLARDHRRALLGAGAGLALAMVVLAAGLSLGRSQFVQAVAGPNLPSTAAGFTFDTTVRFLRASLRTVFAVGLVVAGGAVTLAAVTLVVWGRPTPRVVLWLAVALLVVIAVIELLGRAPRPQAATAAQAARPDGSAGTGTKPPAPVS